jgi:5'-nucleotidase
MGYRCLPDAFPRIVVEKHSMTLSRRALLSASLALPLAAPALRRAAADPVARLALLHMNDFHSKHEGTDAGSASCRAD